MMKIGRVLSKNCQGVSRRELLQVGGLGILGLTLADELRAAEARTANPQAANRSSETACIFIFLEGGPSQLETFDPKPNASDDVRGPYGTIATNVLAYTRGARVFRVHDVRPVHDALAVAAATFSAPWLSTTTRTSSTS